VFQWAYLVILLHFILASLNIHAIAWLLLFIKGCSLAVESSSLIEKPLNQTAISGFSEYSFSFIFRENEVCKVDN